jgi:hypothetical protein
MLEGDKQETLYSSFKESLSDLSYRDILISFQTMFDLFSVDPVISLDFSKSTEKTSSKLEYNQKSTSALEDSISIAKTEVIEWRASYVTQKIEPKINFLKDFSEQFKDENKMSSKTEKKFFYRTVLLPTD